MQDQDDQISLDPGQGTAALTVGTKKRLVSSESGARRQYMNSAMLVNG